LEARKNSVMLDKFEEFLKENVSGYKLGSIVCKSQYDLDEEKFNITIEKDNFFGSKKKLEESLKYHGMKGSTLTKFKASNKINEVYYLNKGNPVNNS